MRATRRAGLLSFRVLCFADAPGLHAATPACLRVRRIAVVTGANRGIGLETARRLADEGMLVVLACRDEAAGREAARRLGAEARALDAASESSCERFVRGTLAAHGRVDVLVNNAAVFLDGRKGVLETDDATLRATFETNLLGPWRLCRALLPGMVERGYGRVVNVSSGAGSLTDMTDYAPAYSASKAALNALTRLCADAVSGAPDVKVNSVCPGWVRTRMGGASAPRAVEEGADTVAWLATLPRDGPHGGFFRDRRPIPW